MLVMLVKILFGKSVLGKKLIVLIICYGHRSLNFHDCILISKAKGLYSKIQSYELSFYEESKTKSFELFEYVFFSAQQVEQEDRTLTDDSLDL